MLFNILLAIIISSISLVILIQTKNLSKKYNFFDNPASEAKKFTNIQFLILVAYLV